MWIPVSIITALVLEGEFDAIFNAINILFDDMCYINVLFECAKVSFIISLLLVNVSFNL